MNAVVSVCLLACALGIIVYLLSRRETTRRSQYGPAGLSEFRTGLALDECFDRLDTRSVRCSRKLPSFSRRHS